MSKLEQSDNSEPTREPDPFEQKGRDLLNSIGWNPEDFADSFLQRFPRGPFEERGKADACKTIVNIMENFHGKMNNANVMQALAAGTDGELKFELLDSAPFGNGNSLTELRLQQHGEVVFTELWENKSQQRIMERCRPGTKSADEKPELRVITEKGY